MAKKQLGIEEIASEVGRLFGTTEAHARKWLDQRNALLEALGTVRDKANSLMTELGANSPIPWGKRKPGRPAKTVANIPLNDGPRRRRGRRKISEETRAKMRAAAQKRWAEKRKAAGGSKRGSLSPTRTIGPKVDAK
jgi:hypothetical protein